MTGSHKPGPVLDTVEREFEETTELFSNIELIEPTEFEEETFEKVRCIGIPALSLLELDGLASPSSYAEE